MESIQTLREKRKNAAIEARKLLDEVEPKDWQASHDEKYQNIMDDIENIDHSIERHEKLLNIEAANRQAVKEKADLQGISEDQAHNNAEMEKSIFNSWLRGGENNLTEEQVKFINKKRQQARNEMSSSAPNQGGVLVPTEFSSTLIEEMKAFGGMRAVASVVSTSTGEPIEFPTADESDAEGEIIGENVDVGKDDDPEFGIKSIGSYKYSSKPVAVPFELLQDSKIDLNTYIPAKLAERIARVTNRHFTVGTGTKQPQGAVSGSGEGFVIKGLDISYDALVELEHSIDPFYRQSGRVSWMFHDLILKKLKQLKDKDGRPIWVPGIAVAEPDTLLNYRYTINQHMPIPAKDAKSVLFGNFKNYQIRDVMQVMLFRMTDSAYTKKGQIGFLAFSRHDGALMDVSGSTIKHIKHTAAS